MTTDRNWLTDAVERNEADLVEDIEVVQMALVENQFQKDSFRINVNRFEFSCLESTSFIRVKTQESKPFEFDLVQRKLVCQSLLSTW